MLFINRTRLFADGCIVYRQVNGPDDCAALQEGTSRQRSGKGAIRKRFPLQKPEVGKNQTNNQVLIP